MDIVAIWPVFPAGNMFINELGDDSYIKLTSMEAAAFYFEGRVPATDLG